MCEDRGLTGRTSAKVEGGMALGESRRGRRMVATRMVDCTEGNAALSYDEDREDSSTLIHTVSSFRI